MISGNTLALVLTILLSGGAAAPSAAPQEVVVASELDEDACAAYLSAFEPVTQTIGEATLTITAACVPEA